MFTIVGESKIITSNVWRAVNYCQYFLETRDSSPPHIRWMMARRHARVIFICLMGSWRPNFGLRVALHGSAPTGASASLSASTGILSRESFF